MQVNNKQPASKKSERVRSTHKYDIVFIKDNEAAGTDINIGPLFP
ncbi:hypothetical protein [Microcoleus sp. FACHB-68]|nr:hypothetical protein [Microcoleus sp. FACHB-68]